MSSCERCWSMAYEPYGNQSDRYQENIATHTCTPEQQAGPDGDECPECHRMTKHQHTGELMCGCEHDPTPWCSYGHMRKQDCDCGPIAEND